LFFHLLFPWSDFYHNHGIGLGRGQGEACNVPPSRGQPRGIGLRVRRHSQDRLHACTIKPKKKETTPFQAVPHLSPPQPSSPHRLSPTPLVRRWQKVDRHLKRLLGSVKMRNVSVGRMRLVKVSYLHNSTPNTQPHSGGAPRTPQPLRLSTSDKALLPILLKAEESELDSEGLLSGVEGHDF
jgi:hypothetical protein